MNPPAFELAPPITATPPFEDGVDIEDIGVNPMQVRDRVAAIVAGINQDRPEIRPAMNNTSNS